MKSIQLIELEKLYNNPYQPRTKITKASVKDLAASIQEHGLLQLPRVRPAPDQKGYYEIAYGHRRVAAIRVLDDKRIWKSSGKMFVDIRAIDDETMFKLAISENESRADLNPIERAQSMRTYRDDFGRTSKEIGALFGLSDSAVRNEIRTLEAPKVVQSAIAKGEMTSNQARQVMTFNKVAPDLVEETTREIVEGDYRNPADVADLLYKKIIALPNAHNFTVDAETKKIRKYLWPVGLADLDVSPNMTADLFLKAFPNWADEPMDRVKAAIKHTTKETPDPEVNGVPSLMIQNVLHMKNPPACTQCPVHILMSGRHFCGIEQCFKRKRKAWLDLEMDRLAGELGILPYVSKRDGKHYDQWFNYTYEQKPKHYDKIFKDNKDQLRLRIDTNGNWQGEYPFTDHKHFMVVHLNPETIRVNVAREKRQEREQRDANTQAIERERKAHNRELNKVFLWKHYLPIWVDKMPIGNNAHFLETLADMMYPNWMGRQDTPENKTDAIKLWKLEILFMMLWDHFDVETKSDDPPAFAELVQKTLTGSFGLKESIAIPETKEMALGFVNEVLTNEDPTD